MRTTSSEDASCVPPVAVEVGATLWPVVRDDNFASMQAPPLLRGDGMADRRRRPTALASAPGERILRYATVTPASARWMPISRASAAGSPGGTNATVGP